MPYLYQEAEKYINDIFWKETHDPHTTLNIPELVAQRLVKANEEKDPEYFAHREGVLHATSLSKCLRGVVYEMLGAEKNNPIDTRKLGVFMAGNLFEDFVLSALKEHIVHEQREYVYQFGSVTLVGRSDYTIRDDGVLRIGENKSVHSDSFWKRQKEGTLVAWQNQVQLQTYMWLERILEPFKDEKGNVILTNNPKPDWVQAPEEKLNLPQGIFSYISKDDCTVAGAPIKYNPHFVDDIIIPALKIVEEGYRTKNPEVAPVPSLVVFSDANHQYQKNWLCKYCDYHEHCAGAGWVLEASNIVTLRNKQLKAAMPAPHAVKKAKPKVEVISKPTLNKPV